MLEVATADMSKQQPADKRAKKTLSLNEKVKFLHFAKANPRFGCRKIAEIFKIGKTAPANVLKEKTVHNYTHFFL